MFNNLMKKKWLMAFFVVLLSILGGISLVLCDVLVDIDIIASWNILKEQDLLKDLFMHLVRITVPLLVFCLLSYFIGSKTSSVIEDFRNKKVNKWFWIIFIIGGIILPICYFIFQTQISNRSFYGFNYYKLIKGIIYDGIIEELIFNYCITSFICFALVKVFCKKSNKLTKKLLILACTFSVLFLFSFQLNALATLYNITIGVLIWAVLQYLVMDLIYVCVYVKYGLRYSILTHVLFSIMLVGVCSLVL